VAIGCAASVCSWSLRPSRRTAAFVQVPAAARQCHAAGNGKKHTVHSLVDGDFFVLMLRSATVSVSVSFGSATRPRRSMLSSTIKPTGRTSRNADS
jgi:hypothetical protein